jgi:hypothetical protein
LNLIDKHSDAGCLPLIVSTPKTVKVPKPRSLQYDNMPVSDRKSDKPLSNTSSFLFGTSRDLVTVMPEGNVEKQLNDKGSDSTRRSSRVSKPVNLQIKQSLYDSESGSSKK